MKLMFPKKAFVIAAIAALALLPASATAADAKIGLVDLKKVFDGYYKTKQASVQMNERMADADKVLKGMREDQTKAREDYKKLMDGSNDQAVSADERDKRKKNAEAKVNELQEIERSIQQFLQTTDTALKEQQRRLREEILVYLQTVIASHAKKGNYTHVLDTAGETRNGTLLLLYSTGQGDMTDDVLAEINANAPAEKSIVEPKSDAKPLPDVLDPSKSKK